MAKKINSFKSVNDAVACYVNDTDFAVVDGVSVVAAVRRVIRFGYFEFKCQIEKRFWSSK